MDMYKVTTTSDGRLAVVVTTSRRTMYSSNPLDINFYLYDNDGTTQLAFKEVYSVGNPTTDSVTFDGLQPGTYYIKLQPFSTNEFADYIISHTLIVPAFGTDAEPNGNPIKAVVLPINTSNVNGYIGYYYNNQKDTADYYKVTTNTKGSLRIILSTSRGNIYSSNPLDFIIRLYSSDGTTQITSKEVYNAGNPATDSIIISGLAAGTYYVRIEAFSTSEFGDYSLAVLDASGVLPVTFINFDGALGSGKAMLSWSTGTEVNNAGFEVERSYDGQSFSGIASVNGHGSTSLLNSYSYIDNKILSGYNYYRLKQVDIDGNFNYSSTIRLDFKDFAWKILGNPVNANTWAQLQLEKTSHITLQIITSDGRVLKTINKGDLPAGTYSIPLSSVMQLPECT